MKLIIILIIAIFPITAFCDGLPLTNGRYKNGDVLILNLNENQIKIIDHYRKCQLENRIKMNNFTPYIFTLTSKQCIALKKKVGFCPTKFQVYETRLGFNDAGPHWNLVLRFNKKQIEIPLDIVIQDNEAEKEHEMQGWDVNNPCFSNLQ